MFIQNLLSRVSSYFHKVDVSSFRQGLRHAFGVGASRENNSLSEKEQAVILKLVTMVQKRRLALPASMFLESVQPLNYLGSQMMVFFRPFLTFFFTPAEYDTFQGILEKREGIGRIIEALEHECFIGNSSAHRKGAKDAKEKLTGTTDCTDEHG